MKNINDLTLKEFELYNELMQEEIVDIFSVLQLFGIENPEKLKFDDFEHKWRLIQQMKLSTNHPKTIYTIKGRKFKIDLNALGLTSAQFIDFQTYMNDFKLNKVLSCFMIPMKKTFFGYKKNKYNDGYDILELQEFLNENMNIGDANEISNFFLSVSQKLLNRIKTYLELTTIMEMTKRMKK